MVTYAYKDAAKRAAERYRARYESQEDLTVVPAISLITGEPRGFNVEIRCPRGSFLGYL